MGTYPFDDEDSLFHVVVNDEEQHSIWPTFAEVPAGWRITFGPASTVDCMAHVDENWTDLRPRAISDLAG
jgi:MbtH protein